VPRGGGAASGAPPWRAAHQLHPHLAPHRVSSLRRPFNPAPTQTDGYLSACEHHRL